MPELELGLWNAWIFLLSYLLMYIILGAYVRLRGQNGSSRPNKPPFNEKEHKLDVIATLIFVASLILSFFLPLKLGTAWLYIGFFVYLFGIVFTIVAGTNFINAPLDRPATKGLYRISRNPIYLGTNLIFIGTGIACASWPFLLLIAIFIIMKNLLIDAEERWCFEKYGESYQEYINKTPKWIGIPKSEKKSS